MRNSHAATERGIGHGAPAGCPRLSRMVSASLWHDAISFLNPGVLLLQNNRHAC